MERNGHALHMEFSLSMVGNVLHLKFVRWYAKNAFVETLGCRGTYLVKFLSIDWISVSIARENQTTNYKRHQSRKTSKQLISSKRISNLLSSNLSHLVLERFKISPIFSKFFLKTTTLLRIGHDIHENQA